MGKISTILFLDNSFTFGGAIISLKTTMEGLDKDRFRPVLVTAQNPLYLSKHFLGIKWYSLEMKLPWIHDSIYRKISGLPVFKNNSFTKKLLGRFRSLVWLFFIILPESFRIYRIGRKQGAGLVHLNNSSGSQLSGIIAAKLLHVPCVAHLRDYEQQCRSARINAGLVDHHIAISESIKDNLVSLGVAQEKISVVYDAVNLSRFPQETSDHEPIGEIWGEGGELLIGWFGRIIRWKGTREFVMSLSSLKEKFEGFRAVVVGDSSDSKDLYYPEVKRLAGSLSLSNKVVFAGYKEDVVNLMSRMDIIAHTSITPEPFGMVIMEAMACGKPVVASNAGGGPLEIVKDGETGFLTDPKDPEKMSDALMTLLKDPDLRDKFGRAGRKRVESMFESSVHVREIEKIYQGLIE